VGGDDLHRLCARTEGPAGGGAVSLPGMPRLVQPPCCLGPGSVSPLPSRGREKGAGAVAAAA
jgi:hypothetical protein